MDKICILDENKPCTNCGECDKCDLDPNKVCNNCGKCLNPDNVNTRSILIDNVIDDETPVSAEIVGENDEILHDYDDDYVEENDEHEELEFEFIDDIDGLNDILNNEDKRNKYINETSPGIFTLKKDKLNR
ncbi:hypothetical protein [Clostridium felsineum]|uniref:Uncharacterized protein n=1 Tax=Clostridium felsineum TaxID=36839 RepID=A0A1S8L4Q7_9CLOT|nr:hypothetical protein [Clostridium felsineum]MCR3761275.1 hypothetical protein [Clostridium felsineum]URZ06676.1 hypothetical protein CLROS_020090 [Clostridium felsineum]URZ11709.1 hypothetical protein CROST_024260 [Clostridium felsineum]